METITQNGEAALVVMSPQTYDEFMFQVHAATRGHIWDEAIEQIEKGEYGRDAREVIHEVAEKHGLKL